MSNFTQRVFLFVFIFLFFLTRGFAQLVVVPNTVANSLAQTLVGPGVTVSNATLTFYGNSTGTFSQTNTNLGLDSGVLLTSGDVQYAVGPNSGPSTGTDNGGPGDADLTALSGSPTFNASILEFDFQTTGDSVKFDYVFGSDEYNDFVLVLYNDVFAFFISGPGYAVPTNIALVPGTSSPTSVGNVNCGNNPQYYVCNDPWNPMDGYCTNQCPTSANGTTIEYDGFTVPLQAKAAVQPCQTYHLKLAIADAIDGIYDSGVFLKAGSLSSSGTSVEVETGYIDPVTSSPAIVEGCFDGSFNFVITNPPIDTSFIHYTVGGTATNGIDYTQLPDSLEINPGDSTASIIIHSFNDAVAEGAETVTLYLFLPCSPTPYDSATIVILDTLVAVAEHDTTICVGQSVQLGANGAESWLWNPGSGLSCTSCQNPVATPLVTTTYTLTITVGGCNAFDQVTVTVDNPLPVSAGPDVSICLGDSIQLNAINANQYTWTPSSGLSCNDCANPFAFPSSTTSYVVTGINGCFTTSDTVKVTVNPSVDAEAFGSTTVCPGDTVQLSSSGGVTYSWSPENGLNDPSLQDPTAVVFNTTTFTVLVTNQFGCTDTASVLIDVYDIPDVSITPFDPLTQLSDTTIYLGNSVTIHATGGGTYSWSPSIYLSDSTSSDPLSNQPQDTITYYLTVTSAEGCKTIDSITIYVRWDALVMVPGAFSPNEDGHNDALKLLVRGIFNLDNFEIFNRWGEAVFQTSNLDFAANTGWDGKYKSKVQPVGVYVYSVSGTDFEGHPIQRQGNITLVR